MKQEDVLDLLRRSGRTLHGERWQVALSRDLNVTDRALRYWLNGANAIPADEVLPKLLAILLKRKDGLKDVIDDIRREMAK